MEKNDGFRKPLISVIITAYNRRNYIRRALDSVLNQTLSRENFEVIVTTNYFEPFLKTLEEQGSLRYLFYEEPGIGKRISDTLSKAKGEYLAFLEDDDIWHREKLQKIYDEIINNPDLVYYHNAYFIISGNKEFDVEWLRHHNTRTKLRLDICELTSKSIYNLFSISAFFNMSSICIRKNVVVSFRKEIRSCEVAVDLFLFFAAIDTGGLMIIDKEKLTKYMVHQSSMNWMLDKSASVKKANVVNSFKYIEVFDTMLVTFANEFVQESIRSYLLEWRVRYLMSKPLGNRREMLELIRGKIRVFFERRGYMRLFLFFSLFYLVSPITVKEVYQFYFINRLRRFVEPHRTGDTSDTDIYEISEAEIVSLIH